ncbi:MAG: hypothetical protein ACTSRS_17430 [Candidatus Helarchaeota archaeon]
MVTKLAEQVRNQEFRSQIEFLHKILYNYQQEILTFIANYDRQGLARDRRIEMGRIIKKLIMYLETVKRLDSQQIDYTSIFDGLCNYLAQLEAQVELYPFLKALAELFPRPQRKEFLEIFRQLWYL